MTTKNNTETSGYTNENRVNAQPITEQVRAGHPSDNSLATLLVGQKVVVRTVSAGVWVGEVYMATAGEVYLIDARRCWSWTVLKGISLSAMAVFGLAEQSRICTRVAVLLPYIELIPMTEAAWNTVYNAVESAPN